MTEPLPIVLIPGLLASPRLYMEQLPELWRHGPTTIADHRRDDRMDAIARRVLAVAPPRFVLIGLSMGGYVSFEILRQEPHRVAKLALLDTSALPDTHEQSEQRIAQVEIARTRGLEEVADGLFMRAVHRNLRGDERLRGIVRTMAEEVGVEAYARQQTANRTRPDSRAVLGSIRCTTLVLVGEGDEMTPPARAAEIAGGISGARLVTVPESGHLSALEQPLAVTRALLELLES
jgi:pimeloyl-ACP methyl ester carboxylesterase